MSHGPGHVQRKLAEIFAENKGGALTTSRLCLLIWGWTDNGRLHVSRRSAVLRAAKTAAWKAGWAKLRVYDLGNENLFVEVTNPLMRKFDRGGTSLYAIAKFVGARKSDVRGYLVDGTIPTPALNVETGAKAPALITYQGAK